jgi:hypothetical protein
VDKGEHLRMDSGLQPTVSLAINKQTATDGLQMPQSPFEGEKEGKLKTDVLRTF